MSTPVDSVPMQTTVLGNIQVSEYAQSNGFFAVGTGLSLHANGYGSSRPQAVLPL